MTQKELDTIFNDSYDELLNSRFSLEEITKRIEDHASDNGTISSNDLAQFFFLENMNFTKLYLHEVLSKVLCK